MRDLIATKSFIYSSKRLLLGQDFMARTNRDAKTLIALGKAKPQRVPGKIAPPPADLTKKIAEDGLKELRAEYKEQTGKQAFHGWDAATIRGKLNEAS